MRGKAARRKKTDDSVLVEGRTCWKKAQAEKAALLQNGETYFRAFRECVLQAEKSIFIIGWDIDSRLELIRGKDVLKARDGAPVTLAGAINHAIEKQPGLNVYILLWCYSLVFAAGREFFPKINWHLKTPDRLHICLDDTMPVGGCHHQKIVVIDDSVAFCGGLDLTSQRWDRIEHYPEDPDRKDPADQSYSPFHDLQMVVSGKAAKELGRLARNRWQEASDIPVPPLGQTISGGIWPDSVDPDFKNTEIGIARTQSDTAREDGVQEIRRLYLKAISRAEKSIYIENQYLASPEILRALAWRMSRKPGLEVVAVSSETPSYSWLESRSMGASRYMIRKILGSRRVARRMPVIFPVIRGKKGKEAVRVHAKLMIIDDKYLQIGSANLNKRSMKMDSECDLAIEAKNSEEREAILRIRDRLLAEHLGFGKKSEKVTRLLKRSSLMNLVRKYMQKTPGFRLIKDEKPGWILPLADPDKPLIHPRYLKFADPGRGSARAFHRILKVALFLAALALAAFIWRVTPLSEWVDPERWKPLLQKIASTPWAPWIVIGGFVLSGFLLFPVTVLVVLTAVTFGKWYGFLYAFGGAMLSAAVSFAIGRFLSQNLLKNLFQNGLLRHIDQLLKDRGILSVMVIRLLPAGPFSAVNIAMGGSSVKFWDFTIGSALALAPGIAVTALIGDQIRTLWEQPKLTNIALVVLLTAVWLGVVWGMQVIVTNWRNKRRLQEKNA